MWRSFICGEILDVKKFTLFCQGMDGICAVLLQNLFSCNLRCFVANPILLQFTLLLCGEKLIQHFVCVEKMTNMMYVTRLSKVAIMAILTMTE